MKRIALVLVCLSIAPALLAQLTKVTRAQLATVCGTARVTDVTTPLWTSGKLKSRVYRAQPGTPAAGLYVYEYSIDLRDVVGVVAIPLITTLSLDFGPVVGTLDLNGDGTPDPMFFVSPGLAVDLAPSGATHSGNTVTFTFNPPVGGGSAPGNGDRTLVFGLVSKSPPQKVTATVKHNLGGAALSLPVQAPRFKR